VSTVYFGQVTPSITLSYPFPPTPVIHNFQYTPLCPPPAQELVYGTQGRREMKRERERVNNIKIPLSCEISILESHFNCCLKAMCFVWYHTCNLSYSGGRDQED
jgi:hypothetical protein